MIAKYIGETIDGKLTKLKIYEVEQYISKDDPVYGNTYVVTTDNSEKRIFSKDSFELMEEKEDLVTIK